MREYHRRNVVVVEPPVGLAAEQAVAQPPAGGDRTGVSAARPETSPIA